MEAREERQREEEKGVCGKGKERREKREEREVEKGVHNKQFSTTFDGDPLWSVRAPAGQELLSPSALSSQGQSYCHLKLRHSHLGHLVCRQAGTHSV